mgnify:CR=1 FL=1
MKRKQNALKEHDESRIIKTKAEKKTGNAKLLRSLSRYLQLVPILHQSWVVYGESSIVHTKVKCCFLYSFHHLFILRRFRLDCINDIP